jgi:hypothetical protein
LRTTPGFSVVRKELERSDHASKAFPRVLPHIAALNEQQKEEQNKGPGTIFLNRNKCICIYCPIMSKPPTFALSCIRSLGLRATQFTLLQALSQAGEVSQGTLAGILAIDSTTLTRTLAIMGAVTE